MRGEHREEQSLHSPTFAIVIRDRNVVAVLLEDMRANLSEFLNRHLS